MEAVPFTPLTAEFLDDMNDNIESLSFGTGFEDGAINTDQLANSSVTGVKMNRVFTNSGFSPSANISSVTIQQLDCVGGLVHGTLVATASIAFNDTSYNIGSWNLASVGVSTIRGGRFTGYSDGGNSIGMISLSAAGSLQSYDWQPNNLSVGAAIELTIISPVVSYL